MPQARGGEHHTARNRAWWDRSADEYQRTNAPQITAQMSTGDIAWGVWGIPESRLHVLDDVTGKDLLELGCGAAQWSIALARRGARPVGLDLSWSQLAHARQLITEHDVAVQLVHASAERVPFSDASFDVVFADYGAFTFADPYRTIPEAARVLRPGGLLAFCCSHPIHDLAWADGDEHPGDRLVRDYFDLRRIEDPDGPLGFQLPFGEWIRLFRGNSFTIEELIEPMPDGDAVSTYRDDVDRAWSRRWPAESIWKARKV